MMRSTLLPVLAAALLLACGDAESTAEKSSPPVAVAAVTVADLLEEIEATGELLALNQAKIAAEVGAGSPKSSSRRDARSRPATWSSWRPLSRLRARRMPMSKSTSPRAGTDPVF